MVLGLNPSVAARSGGAQDSVPCGRPCGRATLDPYTLVAHSAQVRGCQSSAATGLGDALRFVRSRSERLAPRNGEDVWSQLDCPDLRVRRSAPQPLENLNPTNSPSDEPGTLHPLDTHVLRATMVVVVPVKDCGPVEGEWQLWRSIRC